MKLFNQLQFFKVYASLINPQTLNTANQTSNLTVKVKKRLFGEFKVEKQKLKRNQQGLDLRFCSSTKYMFWDFWELKTLV